MSPLTAESVQKILFVSYLLAFECSGFGFVTPGNRYKIKGIRGVSPEHPSSPLLGGNPLHIIRKAGNRDGLHCYVEVPAFEFSCNRSSGRLG